MTGKLIGIVGFMGTGKDTIADILSENGFIKDSFAKTLKDTAATLFGWDREMVDGTTTASRLWREKPDEFWSKETENPNFTPRLALQLLGTEAIRETFAQDFWVSTVVKRWESRGRPNTVITDCRFPNEIQAIRKYGGEIIRVKRGPDPEWHKLIERIQTSNNTDFDLIKFQTMMLNKELPHISETAWIGQHYDHIISNDGTIDDLRDQILAIKI